jgi:hypothetical protein
MRRTQICLCLIFLASAAPAYAHGEDVLLLPIGEIFALTVLALFSFRTLSALSALSRWLIVFVAILVCVPAWLVPGSHLPAGNWGNFLGGLLPPLLAGGLVSLIAWCKVRRQTNLRGLFLGKLKLKLLICWIVVAVAFLIHWLILVESSPFDLYFTRYGRLYRGIWIIINSVPMLASKGASSSSYSYYYYYRDVGFIIASIVQWFVIGFLLSIPIAEYLHDRKTK